MCNMLSVMKSVPGLVTTKPAALHQIGSLIRELLARLESKIIRVIMRRVVNSKALCPFNSVFFQTATSYDHL